MSTALRIRSQAANIYNQAYASAWRGTQVHDPSTWQVRDPDIIEKMERHADIAHAKGFREKLVAGPKWQLTPRKESNPQSDLAVEVGTELVELCPRFKDARLMLASGFFHGSRFGKVHLRPRKLTIGDGVLRTWLAPLGGIEDIDKRQMRRVPKREDQKVSAHWERFDVGKEDWVPLTIGEAGCLIEHRYIDAQQKLGHGTALMEALGHVWYSHVHVTQEALQAVERFAQGIVHAKIDNLKDASTTLPNDEVADAWKRELEDMRARHVLVSDKGDELDIIHPSGTGWQLLDIWEQKFRDKITTLILGSNLPTTATEGGSYALGGIQQNSTNSIIGHDRGVLEDTLSDDFLGCLWNSNRANLIEMGIFDDKPRMALPDDELADPKERAENAAMLHAIGIPLSADEVYEQTGWRKPEDGEDVIEGAVPAPAGGVPGFGFPDPGGGEFGAGVPGI